MIAPVVAAMNQPHQAPVLQLAQARADVGAGDDERLAELVGVHRPAGQVKQRMDLRDGSVEAPACAHLAPVQDESRERGRKIHGRGLWI